MRSGGVTLYPRRFIFNMRYEKFIQLREKDQYYFIRYQDSLTYFLFIMVVFFLMAMFMERLQSLISITIAAMFFVCVCYVMRQLSDIEKKVK